MDLQISVMWRREARSIHDRARLVEAVEAELETLPPSPDRDAASLWFGEDRRSSSWTSMDLAAARPGSSGCDRAPSSEVIASELLAVDASLGMLEVLEGHVDAGLERMAPRRRRARRPDTAGLGVTAFRNAALSRRPRHALRAGHGLLAEGHAYAETIEQSHCAHMMAP